MRQIDIAGVKVGDGCEPFIVAEAGINHNGSLRIALDMIAVASEIGCDAIKFATLKAVEFCNPMHMISYRYFGEVITEPELEMFKRSELHEDDWYKIKAECDRKGIIFFSTPQNLSDLHILQKVGVPCVKVGSDDLTNLELIRNYADTGLPIILSTGMADGVDISSAYGLLRRQYAQFMLLVCTSEYPCPIDHANLKRIPNLHGAFECPVGFSDHTVGIEAGIVAATLGASYFEKHFTLDNLMRGPDHEFSANPAILEDWVNAIRDVPVLLGSGKFEPTEQEKVNRENWRRKSGQKIRGMV